MKAMQEVLAAIGRERDYQDAKWGNSDEHPHEVGGWITVMRRELREAEDAWCSQRGDAGALEEILQVIAVGVACLQQHGVVERAAMRGRCPRCAGPLNNVAPGFSVVQGGAVVCANCVRPGEEVARARGF